MSTAQVRQGEMEASTAVTAEAAGVRVRTPTRDAAAIAHRQWMSREELVALVEVGQELLRCWPDPAGHP